MTQQYKKIRPTRAARARQKSRTPNIPEFTGPDDWDAPAPQAERPAAPSFGAAATAAAGGARPAASAFARAARNNSLEITQDYSYLRADLIRITWTTTILLLAMIALALVFR